MTRKYLHISNILNESRSGHFQPVQTIAGASPKTKTNKENEEKIKHEK